MQFLIDTHAIIWFINGDKQLPNNVRKRIEDIENQCFVSIASIWEIAIKLSLKKLAIKSEFSEIANLLSKNYIEILPVSFEHVQQLLKLDFHHRDPFDRIIISQGLEENLAIITKDEEFSRYDVNIIWKDFNGPANLSK